MNRYTIKQTTLYSQPLTVIIDETTGEMVSLDTAVEAMNLLEEMARDDFDFEKWNNRVVKILGLDE